MKVMGNETESSSEFSETEYADTSACGAGPFRDDPVWHPSLSSACDIQGSIGIDISTYQKEKPIAIWWSQVFNLKYKLHPLRTRHRR
jgi:hypothetical protein